MRLCNLFIGLILADHTIFIFGEREKSKAFLYSANLNVSGFQDIGSFRSLLDLKCKLLGQ